MFVPHVRSTCSFHTFVHTPSTTTRTWSWADHIMVFIVVISGETLAYRSGVHDDFEGALGHLGTWNEWPDHGYNENVAIDPGDVVLIVACGLQPAASPQLVAVARAADPVITATPAHRLLLWGAAYGPCPITMHFVDITIVPLGHPGAVLARSQ